MALNRRANHADECPLLGVDRKICARSQPFRVCRYSITSSARATSMGEISRPIAFAALRLMTSSNLVGCATGQAPGLAPFRNFVGQDRRAPEQLVLVRRI